MTNAPFQTPAEATIVVNPAANMATTEKVDPLFVDLNRDDWEPLAEVTATTNHKIENRVELRKVLPHEHEEHHTFARERLQEIRHTLGDAWRAMEHSIDEAVTSLSSGRDL